MSCGHCGEALVENGSMACPMCKGERYCSAECMKKGWTYHQSDAKCNAHFVDNDVTVATPYMYEDVAPTEVLDQQPATSFINQSFLLTSHNTDGTITQRIIPTIAGVFSEISPIQSGASPVNMPSEGTFKITLEDIDSGDSASVQGEMPYNVISQENMQNPHAERLAGSPALCKGFLKQFAAGLQTRSKYSTVLWPNPRAVQEAFKEIPIEAEKLYDISVQIDNAEPVTQTFRFLLEKSPLNMTPVEKKTLKQSKLGRFYTSMIKAAANAGNIEIALDKSATYNLAMPDGSSVKLTVEMRDDGVAYLVNVEVMQGYSQYGNSQRLPRYNKTPAGRLPKSYSQGSGGVSAPYNHKIECDTASTAHVGALYCALKDRIEDYAQVLDIMKSANKNPTCTLIKELDLKHKEYQKQLRQLGKRPSRHVSASRSGNIMEIFFSHTFLFFL